MTAQLWVGRSGEPSAPLGGGLKGHLPTCSFPSPSAFTSSFYFTAIIWPHSTHPTLEWVWGGQTRALEGVPPGCPLGGS